jgi:hypothetical protein
MAADQTPPIPGLADLAKGEDGRIMIPADRASREWWESGACAGPLDQALGEGAKKRSIQTSIETSVMIGIQNGFPIRAVGSVIHTGWLPRIVVKKWCGLRRIAKRARIC